MYAWYGSDPETDIVKQMKGELQQEAGMATGITQIDPPRWGMFEKIKQQLLNYNP